MEVGSSGGTGYQPRVVTVEQLLFLQEQLPQLVLVTLVLVIDLVFNQSSM